MDSSQTQHNSSPTEALWALLLQKEKAGPPPKNRGLPQVPTAPVDRNATSARILLYDTQARLEQFSSRADSMLKGIQDANYELKQIGVLFEKDRDTLTNDMIDLVNRSQTEIQKVLGQPAQEPLLLAFQEKLELRIEGLNQRLDALQMFNQTHTQALETHSQTLKSIQEQQNALLTAILSLLPLAQGIAPQLELLKACIQEVNSTICSTITTLKHDIVGSLASHCTSRKRRPTVQPTDLSPVALKRIRIEPPMLPLSPSTTDNRRAQPENLIPLASISAESPSPLTFKDSKPTPRKVVRKRSIFATPQLRAQNPEDIPITPSRPNSIRSSPFFPNHLTLNRASPMQHPPPLPKPLSSLINDESHTVDVTPQDPTQKTQSPKTPAFVGKVNHYLAPTSTVPQPSRVEDRKPLLHPPSQSDAKLSDRSFQPEPHLTPSTLRPPPPFQGTPLDIQPTKPQTGPLVWTSGLRKPLATMGSFIPGNKLRDRRSPPREGRRFIPLDDDDDDDEEEGPA